MPCLCLAQESNQNFLRHTPRGNWASSYFLWGGGGLCAQGKFCVGHTPSPVSQPVPPWLERNGGFTMAGDHHDGGFVSLPFLHLSAYSSLALLRNLWNSLRPESGHRLCLPQSRSPASLTCRGAGWKAAMVSQIFHPCPGGGVKLPR